MWQWIVLPVLATILVIALTIIFCMPALASIAKALHTWIMGMIKDIWKD